MSSIERTNKQKDTVKGNSSKHLDQNLDLEQSKATIQPIQFDSWRIMIYHDLWLFTNISQYMYIIDIYNGS